MNSTQGIYAITSMGAPYPAEPIGTRVDIEVGFIEFDQTIPLQLSDLILTTRYKLSESGALLISAEGILQKDYFGYHEEVKFRATILGANQLKGTVVKLR